MEDWEEEIKEDGSDWLELKLGWNRGADEVEGRWDGIEVCGLKVSGFKRIKLSLVIIEFSAQIKYMSFYTTNKIKIFWNNNVIKLT